MTLEEVIIDDLARIKATDVLVYDMTGRSPFYDKIILATVSSDRQANAIVSYLEEDVTTNGYSIRQIGGVNTPWVIIDFNDVILSVFTKEEREHFSLEKLYMDIPVRKVEL